MTASLQSRPAVAGALGIYQSACAILSGARQRRLAKADLLAEVRMVLGDVEALRPAASEAEAVDAALRSLRHWGRELLDGNVTAAGIHLDRAGLSLGLRASRARPRRRQAGERAPKPTRRRAPAVATTVAARRPASVAPPATSREAPPAARAPAAPKRTPVAAPQAKPVAAPAPTPPPAAPSPEAAAPQPKPAAAPQPKPAAAPQPAAPAPEAAAPDSEWIGQLTEEERELLRRLPGASEPLQGAGALAACWGGIMSPTSARGRYSRLASKLEGLAGQAVLLRGRGRYARLAG